MKIDYKDLLTKRKPEPPKENVLPFNSKALRIFKSLGLDETPLVKKAVPVFARILFDIGDNSLNVWSNGRPAFICEFEEAKKGLLLIGTVGTGKSTVLKAMACAMDAEYLSVPELAVMFSKRGADALMQVVNEAQKWDLFLDDLGAEKDLKSYTNAFPIEEIIFKRYDLWKACGARLHLSTNLSGDQIEERYGVRVRDRLREMTTVVSCTGRSLRK